MSFPFTCPSCRQTSQVPDSLAGTQARCPTCSTVVTIPAPKSVRATLAVAPPSAPKLEPAIEEKRPIARTGDVRPAKRKTSGGMIAAIIILSILGLLGVVCCGGLGLAGYFSARRAKAERAAVAEAQGTMRRDLGSASFRPIDEDKLPPSHWVAMLRDGDADEAARARTRLLAAGPLAVPDLRKALADKNPKLRLAAASLLGELGDLSSDAVGDLAKCLADSEPSIRETAAVSLGQIGGSARAAYADLVRATTDASPRVRTASAETLQKFGPPKKDDVEKLRQLLAGPDVDRKIANAKAIEELKADPNVRREIFAPALNDQHLPVRLFAVRVVSATGAANRSAAFAALFPLLEDADAEVRLAALTALKSLGPAADNDLPALERGLGSPHAEARRYCIEGLAAFGPKAASAVPFLAKALRDSDSTVRIAASAALAQIGKPAKEALTDLLQARNDRVPEVRKNAMRALGAIGRERGVVETLLMAAGDTDAEVRGAACAALKTLAPPLGKGDLTSLYPLLESQHVDVRRFCAAELARMGKEAAPILIKIQDALKDRDNRVRASLCIAIGEIGPKARGLAPQLLEAMRAATKDARGSEQAQAFQQASMALTKIGEAAQAMPLLRELLKDKKSPLLREALQMMAAAGIESKPATPELLQLLDNPELRQLVAKALARIGKPVLDDLLKVIDKGNREEKLGAILAIELIGPEARAAFIDLRKLAIVYKDKEVVEAAKRAMQKINR